MKKFRKTATIHPENQVKTNKVVNNSRMRKSVNLELVKKRSELLKFLTLLNK